MSTARAVGPVKSKREKLVQPTPTEVAKVVVDEFSLKSGYVGRLYNALEKLTNSFVSIVPEYHTLNLFTHRFNDVRARIEKLDKIILPALKSSIAADDEHREKMTDSDPATLVALQNAQAAATAAKKAIKALGQKQKLDRDKLQEELRIISEQEEEREGELEDATRKKEAQDIGAGVKGVENQVVLNAKKKDEDDKVSSRCCAFFCKPSKKDQAELDEINREVNTNQATVVKLGDDLTDDNKPDGKLNNLKKEADAITAALKKFDETAADELKNATEKYNEAKAVLDNLKAKRTIIKVRYLTAVSRELMFDLLRAYVVLQDTKAFIEDKLQKTTDEEKKKYSELRDAYDLRGKRIESYFSYCWCPQSDNLSKQREYTALDFFNSLDPDKKTKLTTAGAKVDQKLIDEVVPESPGTLKVVWRNTLLGKDMKGLTARVELDASESSDLASERRPSVSK